MNDWRRENSQPSSSSLHFPPWELYTSIIILTFPTMGILLLAGAITISIVGKNLQLIFANMGSRYENSSVWSKQHHTTNYTQTSNTIVFLSRKKDVWGCGYDLTYEDLSKTLINGLSNCGLSPAWSDRHKVDKLGNHGGQKKSIFSSVGSSNLKLPSKILAPELSTKWSKLVEVVLSHSNLDEISFLALSNLAFPFQVFLTSESWNWK